MFLRGEDEDYTMTTRARLLERIRVTLAGRAAEEIVLGDATTYSAADLRVCGASGSMAALRLTSQYRASRKFWLC